jgi:hypothetical protein
MGSSSWGGRQQQFDLVIEGDESQAIALIQQLGHGHDSPFGGRELVAVHRAATVKHQRQRQRRPLPPLLHSVTDPDVRHNMAAAAAWPRQSSLRGGSQQHP